MQPARARPLRWGWWLGAGLVAVPVGLASAVIGMLLYGASAVSTTSSATAAAGDLTAAGAGLPPVLAAAYTSAAARAAQVAPGCTGMRWPILAGIAQIESGQAAGRQISAAGDITPPIIGPRLDGSGAGGNTTAIRDTDGGSWDGDTAYDRAVGPFQFIPTSWRIYGLDGNDDGVADPHNAFDAALGAVVHLCGPRGAPHDLTDPGQLRAALLGYNRSEAYVAEVSSWIARFDAAAASPVGRGAGVVLARAQTWLAAWGRPAGQDGGPVPYSMTALFEGYRRDCSGYASMALGLAQPGLDTSGLARVTTPIGKDQLLAGDLMLAEDAGGRQGHVVIFERWADSAMGSYVGFEQSSDGGTHHRVIPWPYFRQMPLQPRRLPAPSSAISP
jgi:hypothetical protein